MREWLLCYGCCVMLFYVSVMSDYLGKLVLVVCFFYGLILYFLYLCVWKIIFDELYVEMKRRSIDFLKFRRFLKCFCIIELIYGR